MEVIGRSCVRKCVCESVGGEIHKPFAFSSIVQLATTLGANESCGDANKCIMHVV